VCVYETPGDATRARVMVSSEHASAEATNRVFRGRELLPPELATADGVGRSFAVLPIESQSHVLGHILFEYTAQHAFTCGAIAEAVGIAVRNFRQP